MASELAVDVVEGSEGTVAHVRGEVDVATYEQLRAAVEPHLAARHTLVLDLSAVTFMDSKMLHFLVQARERLSADDGSLVLRNPSAAARRVLAISEVGDLVEGARRAAGGQVNQQSSAK